MIKEFYIHQSIITLQLNLMCYHLFRIILDIPLQMLLYNGSVFFFMILSSLIRYLYFRYPSAYIDQQFRKFFADSISTASILLLSHDEHTFIHKRQKLMGQTTVRQSQIKHKLHNLNKIMETLTTTTTTTIMPTHQPGKNLKIILLYIILMKID